MSDLKRLLFCLALIIPLLHGCFSDEEMEQFESLIDRANTPNSPSTPNNFDSFKPIELEAKIVDSKVELSWAVFPQNIDDKEHTLSLIKGYRVQRIALGETLTRDIAPSEDFFTTFIDEDVHLGTLYLYNVKTLLEDDESPPSKTISVHFSAYLGDPAQPTPPQEQEGDTDDQQDDSENEEQEQEPEDPQAKACRISSPAGVADDGQEVEYFQADVLPEIVAHGDAPPNRHADSRPNGVFWSSQVDLPAELSEDIFITDSRFNLRVRPTGSAQGENDSKGVACNFESMPYQKLNIGVRVRQEGQDPEDHEYYLFEGVQKGEFSLVKEFAPVSDPSKPVIVEIVNLEWDYTCSWYREQGYDNVPGYCPYAKIWDQQCVKFQFEFATSETKDIPCPRVDEEQDDDGISRPSQVTADINYLKNYQCSDGERLEDLKFSTLEGESDIQEGHLEGEYQETFAGVNYSTFDLVIVDKVSTHNGMAFNYSLSLCSLVHPATDQEVIGADSDITSIHFNQEFQFDSDTECSLGNIDSGGISFHTETETGPYGPHERAFSKVCFQ